MFMHLLKNRFKILIRNKSMIFWTLVFPILLGIFFKLALSNISNSIAFSHIPIAVIENENFVQNETFKSVIESISKNDENQIFETQYLEEEEAKRLLEKKEIDGYIVIAEESKLKLNLNENGINQTIIKYVIDEYYQMANVAERIIQYNPENIYNGTMNLLSQSKEYLNSEKNSNLDFCVNYYYTLIAMACIYGSLFGLDATKETEANLSKRAARVNVSPVHKVKMLFVNVLSGFIIQYVEVLILLAFIKFVLGGNFGNNILWILILSFFGCFAGTSFGMLVGVSNKKSEGTKISILISVTMAFCFFAGMMGMPQIKYNLEKVIPFIKYNPVTLITDGLYSLYSYTNLNTYFEKLILIIILSILMFIVSYMFIRRKKYDSI